MSIIVLKDKQGNPKGYNDVETIVVKDINGEPVEYSQGGGSDFGKRVVDRSITTVTTEDLSGVISIGDYAFAKCTRLISVVLPESITYIGLNAFAECTSLSSFTCLSKVPPDVSDLGCFRDVPSTMNIYVPAESLDAYKSHEDWYIRADHIFPIE